MTAKTSAWPISEPLNERTSEDATSASEGAALARAGLDHWLQRRFDEARTSFEQAIPLLRPAGDTPDLADSLANLAGLVYHIDFDRSVDLYQEARQLYQRLKRVGNEALVTRNLASLYASKGHYDTAENLYNSAIETARQAGHLRTEGVAITGLAIIKEENDQLQDAVRLHEKALPLFQRAGDVEAEAVAHAWISMLQDQLGDTDRAKVSYRKAVERFKESPRSYSLLESLRRTAHRLRQLRFHDQARELYELALLLSNDLGDSEAHASMLRELGTLTAESGDLSATRAFYELAAHLHRSPNERRIDALALGSLSARYSERQQLAMAKEIELKALEIHRDLGDIAGEAGALGSLGSYEERMGHLDVAEDLYSRGLDLARKAGHREHEALSLMGLAGVYHQTGRSEEATSFQDQALKIATEIEAEDLVRSLRLAKAIVQRDTDVVDRLDRLDALMDEWVADDSGYDEKTWPQLKKGLEEDRLSYRKRFRD